MTQAAAGATRPDAALIATLEAADYHPLWDRYWRITPLEPKPKDVPMLWRWKDFEPFVERAAREVPIEDVERRAIIMAHPAFGGQTVTTGNLLAAFTILEPGDRAVPHRHSAAAIRFATRAEGAVTLVNGRRCEMHDGDLVLTPPMCWHGHINEGDRRTVWFDAANMPLVCALDASFFEPGRRDDREFWKKNEGEERLWSAAGLAPASPAPAPLQSPKYRYPGAETRRMLAALAPGADGARTLRYVNPATGGPVMPTLDCYASRLARGVKTRPWRATYHQIVLVVSGEGRSTVGSECFEWSRHDVFTVPQWTFASHEAASEEADFFIVSDRPVYESLELLRVEYR